VNWPAKFTVLRSYPGTGIVSGSGGSGQDLENTYRCINIAMVNELKMLFDRMGIDVWEVIRAASTKPFGYHPFYPARAGRALYSDRSILSDMESPPVSYGNPLY